MSQITFSIPEEVLYDTKMSHEQATQFARQAVALSYYTQRGVSVGYCAQIAGMTEEEFIKYLGQNHISIFKFNDEEEFLEELDNTQQAIDAEKLELYRLIGEGYRAMKDGRTSTIDEVRERLEKRREERR